MQTASLIVALGLRRYRVDRPWGDLPNGPVTDVTVDSRGHVYVLLRFDPFADANSPRVIELELCAVDGLHTAIVTKSDRDGFRLARKVRWGDAFPVP